MCSQQEFLREMSLVLYSTFFRRGYEPIFDLGEVMSQFSIWARLCVGKTSIGSSIQAQNAGGFLWQEWRGYGFAHKIYELFVGHQPNGAHTSAVRAELFRPPPSYP